MENNAIKTMNLLEGPIKQSINSVFEGLNSSIEALDIFQRYYNAHINSIKEEVQYIKLLGMTQPSLLINLYNPAKVSTTIRRRLFTDQWVRQDRNYVEEIRTKDVISGDEFIGSNKNIAILGGPGAGKTTFLKYLGLAYSDKTLFKKTKLKNDLTPFFISLPTLAKYQDSVFNYILEPLVEKTTKHAKAFLNRIFKKGLAILLLDSLDEVPKSKRDDLIEKIKLFHNKYAQTKIVLSCRTADYNNTNLEFLDEVEIARLDKESTRKIIKAFFDSEPDKGHQLKNIIDHDPSIDSLTETPLLLSLLCIQFRHDLSLPRRKVELFERCSQTLLREWDTTRRFRRETAYQALTDQTKERLFSEIAYSFSNDNLAFIFPKAATIEIVSNFCSFISLEPSDAIGILDEVDCHHGIIEQFSQDHYSFSHTSFQDYFAAKAIVSRGEGLKYTQKHLENSDWHSIIEFIVALEQNAGPIIEFLIAKSNFKNLTNYPPMAKRTNWLRLLYRCLATTPYLDIVTRKKSLRHIVESQFEIARIYTDGGVYPMSQLLKDGIQHPYYYSHKRQSLSIALQPFKKLSNEILKTNVLGYPEAVLELIPKIEEIESTNTLLKDALLLNLVTPLVSTKPHEVINILNKKKQLAPNSATSRIVENTLENISPYLSQRGIKLP